MDPEGASVAKFDINSPDFHNEIIKNINNNLAGMQMLKDTLMDMRERTAHLAMELTTVMSPEIWICIEKLTKISQEIDSTIDFSSDVADEDQITASDFCPDTADENQIISSVKNA